MGYFLFIICGICGLIFLYIFILIICSIFVNSSKEYEKDSPFYRFLLHSATGIAIKILRIKIHIAGIENIPKNTKVLFVGNHRSNYDPILTWYVFHKWKPAFISKKENFDIPIFGHIIRKCCFMAIDRDNPRKAMATINKAAKLLKKQEVSIGVYPEGTRSRNCELLPFHNAVFKIAQKADAPIIVLAVCGTEKIFENIKKLKKSDVYIQIADVMSVEKIKNAGTHIIGDSVREKIKNSLEGMEIRK